VKWWTYEGVHHTTSDSNYLELFVYRIENQLNVMEQNIIRYAPDVVIISRPQHYRREEFLGPTLVCLHGSR